MKPQSITIDEQEEDQVRLTCEFGADDVSSALRMVNRMLAYKYEIDSRSDEDIPLLLAEKLGDAAVREEYNQVMPGLLTPFVVDSLDFETQFEPEIVEAPRVEAGASYKFTLNVRRKPRFELSSYDPVVLVVPKARFDEEELVGYLASIVDEYAEYETVAADEPAQLGDRITLDIRTYGEYGPVFTLSGTDMTMRVGEGWMSPEFDENIIGLKTGEERRFTIQALTEASAHDEDKERLTVDLTVKAIARARDIDITDEWIAAHIPGFDTVDQLKQDIQRNFISGHVETEDEERKLAAVAEELASRLDMDISDDLYQWTVNDIIAHMEKSAQENGQSFDEHLQAMGLSMDTLGDYLMSTTRTRILQGFALDAYYRHFDLELTDADIDWAITKIIGVNRLDAIDSFRRQYQLAGKMYELREMARRLKANSVALERAVVHEER